MNARTLGPLIALALLATGCAGPAGGVRAPTGPVTASVNPNTPALVAARQAAGLPDCDPPLGRVEPVLSGLPDLALPCMGSEKVLNLSQLRGRPMVVNLWAQWCEPCRAEAPILSAFAIKTAGRVNVYGIDYNDPKPADAIEFARASGWRYPHLIDANRVLSGRMQIVGIPVTLLVDAEGRVVYRRTGVLASAAELDALVHQHLGVTP